MLNALRSLVVKIENMSLKNKVFIFLCLLVFSWIWVVLRNPVYAEGWVNIFPVDNSIGDGYIYYGIKSGYNKTLSHKIQNNAFYYHKTIEDIDFLTEILDNSGATRTISIINGIHIYWLSGNKLILSEDDFVELPRKNIQILIVKNGQKIEIFLSSIVVNYKKGFLNRDVAATFPFYIAYSTNSTVTYDKSAIDEKLYDVSFERSQYFAENYQDLSIPHYRALNFKRSIRPKFDYYNKRLIRMLMLSTIVFALFLFFAPFNLLKVFVSAETNRKLFIGLGVYLFGNWLLFRHSGYSEWDGLLTSVIDISHNSVFSHAYMIFEYIFYLIGYSSRTFTMFLVLCIIVWNYNKILEKYFHSNIAKLIKYFLIFFPLLSADIIMFSYIVERNFICTSFLILGYVLFFRSRLIKDNKMFIISVLILLLSITIRMDYVVFFIPVLLYSWIKNITAKRTLIFSICGIVVVCFSLLAGSGTNTSGNRAIFGIANSINYIIDKHKDEFNDQEKRIIENIYNDDLNHFTYSLHSISSNLKKKTTKEEEKLFIKFFLKQAIRYPGDSFNHFVFKFRRMFSIKWLHNYVYSYFSVPTSGSNIYADLPHKKMFTFGESILSSNPMRNVYLKYSILMFSLVCIALFPFIPITASLSVGILGYYILVGIMMPGSLFIFILVFIWWLYFLPGLFIAETVHSGKIKKSWVLPANIIMILVFLAFAKGGIVTENMTKPVLNEQSGKWERSVTMHYPYYHRIFGKSIMLSSVDGASRESMQYMVETLTSTGEPLTSESFAVTPINRQLLESVSVPGRAESVKITFETVDNDVNFEVWPRIDIRKFILSALLLLFLYVNISFLKKKLFIINARWLSTKDNHTGMYYLAKKMAKKYPYFAQVIAVPELHEFWKKGELYNKINTLILYYIKLIAGKDDTVFLMEYFFDGTLDQTYLSMKLHNRVKLVALAHLVPARVAQSFSGEDILRGTSCLDKLLVFGSALRNYYLQKGVSETKVISTYHYVDNNYYRIKQRDKKTDGPLTVIAMGNVERNFDQLFEIIRETPDIRYKIFRGMNVSLDERCANFPNVNLYKHVEEDDLRRLMHESDVSLNVMNDVVGSNVVSTSLSCGLAMVCSDVGSIRDYVDPESGILFTNTSEAIEGLWRLNNDRNFLHSLQLKSLQKSNEIDMEPWTRWLSEFLTKKEQ